jgi:hypothetical protein
MSRCAALASLGAGPGRRGRSYSGRPRAGARSRDRHFMAAASVRGLVLRLSKGQAISAVCRSLGQRRCSWGRRARGSNLKP